MQVGVVILPEYPVWEAQQLWQSAESIGFDHAWTYDHLAWRSLRSSTWYSAVPTLTAAALATQTLVLGTLVASPNFRHPVLLAKDIMTLDDISRGRIVLGIGAGAPGLDEQIIGQPVISSEARGHRYREFVEVVDALLRSEATDHQGDFYQINSAPMVPGCIQLPRVPFAIAATGPRGIQLAAEFAQIWVTNGDPRRFRELPEAESLSLISNQREQLLRECRRIGRDFSEVRTMVNGSVVGDAPTASLRTFLDFAHRCADLGFTDLTVHFPRVDGIFAGCRTEFTRIMTKAIPILHAL